MCTIGAVDSPLANSIEGLLVLFEGILEESRLSTSGTKKLETNAEKMEWWECRLQLDSRMQALLRYDLLSSYT